MKWIPVRTHYSLRQVRNSNSTIRTSICHGRDARSTDMEIACRRSTVWTAIPHGPDARSMRPSGRQCLTVRTRLSNRKDFQRKISEFWSHSCPSGQPMSTVQTELVFIKAVTHLNPQPINRGLWALRTARVR
jgi:hypothetical protein